MNRFDVAQVLLFFVPVMVLLGIGLVLALRSGVRRLLSLSGLGRLVLNVSKVIAVTAAWTVAVAAVQHLIGARFTFPW